MSLPTFSTVQWCSYLCTYFTFLSFTIPLVPFGIHRDSISTTCFLSSHLSLFTWDWGEYTFTLLSFPVLTLYVVALSRPSQVSFQRYSLFTRDWAALSHPSQHVTEALQPLIPTSSLSIVVTRYFSMLLVSSPSLLPLLSPSGTFHSKLPNVPLSSSLLCMLPMCFS